FGRLVSGWQHAQARPYTPGVIHDLKRSPPEHRSWLLGAQRIELPQQHDQQYQIHDRKPKRYTLKPHLVLRSHSSQKVLTKPRIPVVSLRLTTGIARHSKASSTQPGVHNLRRRSVDSLTPPARVGRRGTARPWRCGPTAARSRRAGWRPGP